MKFYKSLVLIFLLSSFLRTFSQDEYLYSSDGRTILRQRELIQNCLAGLNKTKTDESALQFCECQTNLINHQFTYKQFKKYTVNDKIHISELIKTDSITYNKIKECLKSYGQVGILSAGNNEINFLNNCKASLQKNSKKIIDPAKATTFCYCQLELIKAKKYTDEALESINNPNSLSFYELLYKCGNPYAAQDAEAKNWTKINVADITGPETDSVAVLNLDGMTYLKLKVGSQVLIWLLDTGASDLLITKEMENILMEEKIINESNYLGIGEYEMANGVVDKCKRYKISGVKIGHFIVDNIIVAVTEKGKKIIAGKSLLNKFKNWELNNEQNKLILRK